MATRANVKVIQGDSELCHDISIAQVAERVTCSPMSSYRYLSSCALCLAIR